MRALNIRGPRAALIAAAVACGPAASAAAQTTPAAPPATPQPTTTTRARADRATASRATATHLTGDSAAAAQARADSARYPYTAADIRFMTAMMGHHAQAITMSRMAPTHGASPEVRTLASRIINAQQDEIATMGRWLRDRHQPVPDVLGAGAAHAAGHDTSAHDMSAHDMSAHDMSGHDMSMPGMAMGRSDAAPDMAGMLMPGMLTAAQMAQLDRARGAEFDRLFLTFMIQHHRGAVGMVDGLFGTYGAGQDETVFKFASDVHVDQTTEIARMQRMLVALLSDP